MKFILFFILIAFTSCDSPNIQENPYHPSKQSLVNEVRNRTFAQLKREKELYPCGIGAGMMDQVAMLALSFDYYKKTDINLARELLMGAGMSFLKTINSNEQIRSYLKNYPFLPENIEIRIFLQNKNISEFEPEGLSVITLIDGVLRYKIKNQETECLVTIYEETYEEAATKLVIKSSAY